MCIRDRRQVGSNIKPFLYTAEDIQNEEFNPQTLSLIHIVATGPSHRALAMFRGRNEGVLQLSLNADPQFDEPPKESRCV